VLAGSFLRTRDDEIVHLPELTLSVGGHGSFMQKHGSGMYLLRAVLKDQTYLSWMRVNELAHQKRGPQIQAALQIRKPDERDGRIGRTETDFWNLWRERGRQSGPGDYWYRLSKGG